MNWTVILIVGVVVVALIFFLVKRNLKDKKDLENKIEQDYRKPGISDIESDEKMK